jgi:hypothetical protein
MVASSPCNTEQHKPSIARPIKHGSRTSPHQCRLCELQSAHLRFGTPHSVVTSTSSSAIAVGASDCTGRMKRLSTRLRIAGRVFARGMRWNAAPPPLKSERRVAGPQTDRLPTQSSLRVFSAERAIHFFPRAMPQEPGKSHSRCSHGPACHAEATRRQVASALVDVVLERGPQDRRGGS